MYSLFAHVVVHEEGNLLSSIALINIRTISSNSGVTLHTAWNQILPM